MTIPLFHVDAFTDRPFAGNPAAICLLSSWKGDRWLQAVAGEITLDESYKRIASDIEQQLAERNKK